MPGQFDNETSTERLIGGYAGSLFILLSVGWFGVTIGRQLLPPVLPAIVADLNISSFQAGLSLTVLWAMRAVNNYPGGRLADQLSRKTILVSSLVILALGFLLLGVAVTYPLLLVGVGVLGAGAGFYSVAIRTTTADLFTERRAQAYGVQNAIIMAGSASAGAVAVVVIATGTWRAGFVPIAVFFLVVSVVVHRWMREPYVIQRIDLAVFDTFRRITRRRMIRRGLVAYILWFFAWQGLIGFLPTFLQMEKGWSTATASGGFAMFYIIGIVFGPLAGTLGDRFAKLPVILGSLLTSVVGLIGLITVESSIAVVLMIGLVSAGFMSFPPTMQAYLMDSFTESSMGGDLGAVKTTYGLGGSLGPAYVGLVAGIWSYTTAYYGLALCLLVSLAIVGLIHRK